MDTIPLKPERQAELEKFAREHGQTPDAALDDAVAAYLEAQRQEIEEAVESIRQGYEDVKAGRTALRVERGVAISQVDDSRSLHRTPQRAMRE